MRMLADTIRTRGLHVGIRFAPAATLDRHHKQQFQIKASEGFDWRRQEYAEQAWQLSSPQAEGDPRSCIKVSLQREVVNFEDVFPVGSIDLFFDNLKLIMETIATVFNPRLIIGVGAVVRMTAQTDGGDARVFLGNNCMHLESRLEPLGRPLHAVGLKMMMPPLSGPDQPNWQADVKIESLVEDFRQLFIELDAKWGQPGPWRHEDVAERFKTAHEFATVQVIRFLEQFNKTEPESPG